MLSDEFDDIGDGLDMYPFRVRCNGCLKSPHELYCYTSQLDPGWTESDATDYVIFEEGTYNPDNGHFLCDECYIKAGMPSAPEGWKAP
jgi:hypothetical protein